MRLSATDPLEGRWYLMKESEPKPNRVFRRDIIRIVINEVFKKTEPPEVYEEPVGIGATTEVPHLRLVEDPFPNNWDDDLPPRVA